MTTTTKRVRRGRGRPLLKDQAYETLKRQILDGDLPPGSFLSEQRLADTLKVSKAPVRCALIQLKSEGLVSISPRQGAVVTTSSPREIAEIFDIRKAQEPYLARRLAGRLRPDQVAELEKNLTKQLELGERNEFVAATQNDFAFHLLLYEFLDNQLLLQFIRHVFDKLYRDAVQVSRHADGRPLSLYAEHRQIADAIIQGDADLAARHVLDHLEFGRRFLAMNGAYDEPSEPRDLL